MLLVMALVLPLAHLAPMIRMQVTSVNHSDEIQALNHPAFQLSVA